jgi:hypothetical protein
MKTAVHDFSPEEIMAYRDGELPVERSQDVARHLAVCAECRNLAESFETTSEALAGWKIDGARGSLQPRAWPARNSDAANAASLPSWRLVRNRGVFLTLGLLATIVLFVFVKMRSADRSQTRVDLYQSRASSRRDHLSLNAIQPLAPPPAGRGQKSAAEGQPSPLVARTAELLLIARDFDAARAAVESILARHHGYAANLAVSDAGNAARTLSASLRIPSPELQATLSELKALGHVSSESQGGEEVTAQHADLVARLKNSRETETRLQEILRTRTGKVSEVLEVEQEIASVRGEIEEMESQLKLLDHRLDYTTITLSVSEEYNARVSDSTPGIATRFHNAAVAGLENVRDSAVGLALWCAEFLPPLVFWLLILGAPMAIFWRLRGHAIARAAAWPPA